MAAAQTGSARFTELDTDRNEIPNAKYVFDVMQLDKHQTDMSEVDRHGFKDGGRQTGNSCYFCTIIDRNEIPMS